MFSPKPIRVALPATEAELDAVVESLPREAAIFLVDVGEGQKPYLSRSSNLWRRMRRLLRKAEGSARLLNLRGIARELHYWPTSDALSAGMVMLEQARTHFPEKYRRMLRLRLPHYVSVLAENRFPRAIISRKPMGDDTSYGPFATRSEAESFLSQALDLFLLRRCEEELDPRPDHPGCIYGEMAMCLRPCQAAVSDGTYREETNAFLSLLLTDGDTLREQLETERESASDSLDFEAAAKVHKRLSKLNACFSGHRGFACQITRFHGVAVTPAPEPGSAMLWPMWAGHLQAPTIAEVTKLDGSHLTGLLSHSRIARIVRSFETNQEILSVLTKWVHSSWCDGEWIRIQEGERMPIRRLRNAIRRVAGVPPEATASFEAEHASTGAEGGASHDAQDL